MQRTRVYGAVPVRQGHRRYRPPVAYCARTNSQSQATCRQPVEQSRTEVASCRPRDCTGAWAYRDQGFQRRRVIECPSGCLASQYLRLLSGVPGDPLETIAWQCANQLDLDRAVFNGVRHPTNPRKHHWCVAIIWRTSKSSPAVRVTLPPFLCPALMIPRSSWLALRKVSTSSMSSVGLQASTTRNIAAVDMLPVLIARFTTISSMSRKVVLPHRFTGDVRPRRGKISNNSKQ